MVASKIYTASILAAMIPLALHAADTAADMDPAAPGSNQQNGARSAAPGPFFCAAGAGLVEAPLLPVVPPGELIAMIRLG
mgnify:CR=1 FL=1